MPFFTWLLVGTAGVLMVAAAVCWGMSVVSDNHKLKKVAQSIFRIGLMLVLVVVNLVVYAHLFGVAPTDTGLPALTDEA